MIITCPNCGARYRLAMKTIAENTRMRCAACDHRWVIEPDEELPILTPEPAPLPSSTPTGHEIPPAAMHESEPASESPGEPPEKAAGDQRPPSMLLRNLAAAAIGSALAIAAAGLWLARIDPVDVPMLGDRVAALSPRALPLKLAFTAQTTALASGDNLLEINGLVTNTGTSIIFPGDLEARLSGPDGTVRRWRIAAPAARLAPNQSARFTSMATGFPANATTVGIRPAR